MLGLVLLSDVMVRANQLSHDNIYNLTDQVIELCDALASSKISSSSINSMRRGYRFDENLSTSTAC